MAICNFSVLYLTILDAYDLHNTFLLKFTLKIDKKELEWKQSYQIANKLK